MQSLKGHRSHPVPRWRLDGSGDAEGRIMVGLQIFAFHVSSYIMTLRQATCEELGYPSGFSRDLRILSVLWELEHRGDVWWWLSYYLDSLPSSMGEDPWMVILRPLGAGEGGRVGRGRAHNQLTVVFHVSIKWSPLEWDVPYGPEA